MGGLFGLFGLTKDIVVIAYGKRKYKNARYYYRTCVRSTIVHYLENGVKVVDFANAHGLVMF